MNHFDDEAPLSKIGIAALVAMFIGCLITPVCFFAAFLCDFKTIWFPINVLGLLVGFLLLKIGACVASSKKAYKDLSGRK